MRIIKNGKMPEKEWKKKCRKCGCVFIYDKNDILFDQRDGDAVKCPTCGNWINIDS